jgi:hypothetical protein
MESRAKEQPPKEETNKTSEIAGKALKDISEAKGKMLGAEMEKAQGKPAVTSIKEAKPEMTKEEAALKRKVALLQYQRERSQANADAQREIKRIPLKDAMNVKAFVSDVKEATKRVKEFQDKGNIEKAQEWRRRQLKSMELTDMAKKAALEVMKKRNDLRRFARIERKPLKMPNGHWLMIKSLLENSEIKPPSKVQEKLHRQIAESMAQDPGANNDDIADATGYYFTKSGALIPEDLGAFRERVMKTDPDLAGTLNIPENMKMNDMTLGDFRNLNTAIKAIYKNGRDADNLDFEFGKVSKTLSVDELTETLKKNLPTGGWNTISKYTDMLLIPMFGHITRLANVLDGNTHGPFNKLIVNPLLDGLSKRDGHKIDMLTRLQSVHDEHYPNNEDRDHNKMIRIKPSKGLKYFSKNELKHIYAYMGQPDALTALITGNKWTLQDLRTMIDHLDENDLHYMESIGKELDKDFPEYAKTKMDLDGIEPKKADTSDVETKFGIRKGFYFPMKYKKNCFEAMTDWGKAVAEDRSKIFSSRVSHMPYTHYNTPQKFLESRTGVTGIELDTINSPLARHVEDTSRFLGVQKAAKQVGKILNDKRMMESMKEHIGPGAAIFKQMVEYVSASGGDVSTSIDKLFAVPRALYFAHKIGFRPLLYPLKGLTDLGNVMFFPGEYGGMAALASMKDHGYSFSFDMPDGKGGTNQTGFKSERMRQLVDAVTSKDPMMKMSAINYDWNARELTKQFSPSELKNWIVKRTGKNLDLPPSLVGAAAFLKMNVYMMERNADRQVRFPLWWHVYSSARANGMVEADAVRDATKYVNDKLGSGEELYHVGPQRGNELFKQIAPVISFGANQFNQWWEHGYRNGLMKGKMGNSILSAAMVMSAASAAYYIYPATLKWMINETVQRDHKKSGERFWRDVNDEAFQGMPVVGWTKYSWMNNRFDLPSLQFFNDNMKAIKSLKNIHHFTEKDWQTELNAITEDFPLPTSLENPVMNLIDYHNHPDKGWSWKDFISKRPLPREHKSGHFF